MLCNYDHENEYPIGFGCLNCSLGYRFLYVGPIRMDLEKRVSTLAMVQLFLFTVPHLISAESLCTTWVRLLCEWSAAQKLSVTEVHPVLATAVSAGCPEMGRTKRHLWVFSLFPGGESES